MFSGNELDDEPTTGSLAPQPCRCHRPIGKSERGRDLQPQRGIGGDFFRRWHRCNGATAHLITQLPKLEPSVLCLFLEEKIVVTAEVELASRHLL